MNARTACFRTLSQVWPATGTPVLATFISGLAAAFASLLIQLEVLVEMMSIGKEDTTPSNPAFRQHVAIKAV